MGIRAGSVHWKGGLGTPPAGNHGQFLTVLSQLDLVVAHQVYAGWFGPPDADIPWEEYQGILERIVAARVPRSQGNPPADRK